MMPDIEREERRKKRAPVIAFILFGMLVVAALVQPGCGFFASELAVGKKDHALRVALGQWALVRDHRYGHS